MIHPGVIVRTDRDGVPMLPMTALLVAEVAAALTRRARRSHARGKALFEAALGRRLTPAEVCELLAVGSPAAVAAMLASILTLEAVRRASNGSQP